MVNEPALRREVRALVAGTVRFDEPMARHTSMGVGGNADMLIFPKDVDDLRNVIIFMEKHGILHMPVGNGTNLIVRDGGYRGALVSLELLKEIEKKGHNGSGVALFAGAGVLLSRLVDYTIAEALSGLEFCAGIPGSVGGGVRMNAGARGREMKDVVSAIDLMDCCGKRTTVGSSNLSFEYRRLRLPEGSIITGATFALGHGEKDVIRRDIAAKTSLRRKEQPLDARSAGCIFRNPAGGFAGKLIDEAGLKGRRIGGACVSDRHANYIVNMGNARAGDVIALMGIIRREVEEKFGVHLETEVHIIGEDRA